MSGGSPATQPTSKSAKFRLPAPFIPWEWEGGEAFLDIPDGEGGIVVRVALVSQIPLWRGGGGGTEGFAEELAKHLILDHDVLTLSRTQETIVADRVLPGGITSLQFPLSAKEVSPNRLGPLDPGLTEDYLKVLQTVEPDVVHLTHVINLGLEVIWAADLSGLPIVFTVPDFFTSCPVYNLIDWQGHFCGVPDDQETCRTCLKAKFGQDLPRPTELWRQRFSHLVRATTVPFVLHFPCEDTRKWTLKAMPELSSLPHVILPAEVRPPVSPSPRRAPRSDRVAIIGYASENKGRGLLLQALPKLTQAGYKFHFVGSSEKEWPLPPKVLSKCVFHGPYKGREEVEAKLREIRPLAALFASIWPETWMRTLTEAWAAGVPALVPALGAPMERVGKAGGGFLLHHLDDPQAFSQEVLSLLPQAACLKAPPIPSGEAVVDGFTALYDRILKEQVREDSPMDLAASLARFTGRPLGEVRFALRAEAASPGWHVKEAWNRAGPVGDDAVERFYQETDAYLFDLAAVCLDPERRRWRRAIANHMASRLPRGATVLDYGAGIGNELAFLGRQGWKGMAWDLPGKTRSFLRFRMDSVGIDFQEVEDPSSALEVADAVICLEVLEHVTDPPQIVANLARALRPGGTVYVTESFGLVDARFPSHLPKNLAYVGKLPEMAAQHGLTLETVLLGRIYVFKKTPMAP